MEIILGCKKSLNKSDIDYKTIFEIIMHYYVDIKTECSYYYELTLFFFIFNQLSILIMMKKYLNFLCVWICLKTGKRRLSFHVFIRKILDELDDNISDNIIYNYYNKLLSTALNKIFIKGKQEELLECFIKKDLRTLILLLYSNNSSVICIKRFITRNKYTNTFKYEALFIWKKKFFFTKCKILSFLNTTVFILSKNRHKEDFQKISFSNADYIKNNRLL